MRTAALLLALALAACTPSEDGGSRDEARQLDEAAAAIDINASLFENAANATESDR